MKDIVRMSDLHFSSSLFENYRTGTVLDKLLCSYSGLPKGVNYMIIGDPDMGAAGHSPLFAHGSEYEPALA